MEAKESKRLYDAEYRRQNAERLQAVRKAYSQTEHAKELARARRKRWADVHPEEMRQARLNWVKAHPEEVRRIYTRSAEKNHDTRLVRRRANYPAARKERNAAYYQAHKAHHKAWLKEYRAQHPDWMRHWYSLRRARHSQREGALTLEQWQAIKVAYGHQCAYCGKRLKRLTKDHVVPVAHGGDNRPSNIVPACQPCNSRKHIGEPPRVPPKRLML